jgi:hypothetical protein
MLTMEWTQCLCQSFNVSDKNDLLEEFAYLRGTCPVLRDIIVPDTIWENFRRVISTTSRPINHESIVLGAFRNGFLKRMTLPIHRYLLNGSAPARNLKSQYRTDLVEKWIFANEKLKRHKEARIFKGKLIEIMIASWLADNGWTINNLEALGGKFDIEATSPEQISYAIEVKYIGMQDYRYIEIENSLESGEAVGGWWNLYDGYNFILFKIFEAAKQLSTCTKNRLALLVTNNVDWDFLKMPIEEKWICDRPFNFSDDASALWDSFITIKKQEKRFANIDNELDTAISGLKDWWILKENDDFTFSLEARRELANDPRPSRLGD